MTSDEIVELRNRRDLAWLRLCRVQEQIGELRSVETDLRLEVDDLGELIAEYEEAIAAAANRVVTEDDGEAA